MSYQNGESELGVDLTEPKVQSPQTRSSKTLIFFTIAAACLVIFAVVHTNGGGTYLTDKYLSLASFKEKSYDTYSDITTKEQENLFEKFKATYNRQVNFP